ncbi:MAG: PEP-CTERM sorting domain-containing protein [Marinobacter sp.]|uniref:PEP-CTERM sorting domain-containing protein n=1 Tax=Marinobacter sp. TaxID=50741 RepID=UPI00299EB80B|nr:PEP-CTERM sorting domain-containing protein [Marinobacter sp.]MDX1757845.1 PEP-CTERM sorting domain-containing protein [Marinobacter sp.]
MQSYLAAILAGALLMLSGAAFASPITLTDITHFTAGGTDAPGDLDGSGGDYVNKLEGAADYVAWTHQYTFEPAAGELISGTISLWLRDDEGDVWYDPWTWELGVGVGEDGTWDLGGIDTGNYSYDLDVNTLADGSFSVLLASLGGDFYIDRSVLEITYHPVPEPGTLALLGCGLVGLALGRSRRSKR